MRTSLKGFRAFGLYIFQPPLEVGIQRLLIPDPGFAVTEVLGAVGEFRVGGGAY